MADKKYSFEEIDEIMWELQERYVKEFEEAKRHKDLNYMYHYDGHIIAMNQLRMRLEHDMKKEA